MAETYLFETMTVAHAMEFDSSRDIVVIGYDAARDDRLPPNAGNDVIVCSRSEPRPIHKRGRFKRNARKRRR